MNSSPIFVRERRAVDGDRGGENEARPIGAAGKRLLAPDRLEQSVGSADIDGVALVEIRLGLAGDHRGEQENDIRPRRSQLGRDVRRRDVEGVERDREGRVLERLRRDDVDEMRVVDRLAREASVAGETRRELPPDHARRADDEHFHQKLPPFAAPGSSSISGPAQSRAVLPRCISQPAVSSCSEYLPQ